MLADCILHSPNFLGLDMGSDNHRHIHTKVSLLKGTTQKIIFSHKDYNLERVNLTKVLILLNRIAINTTLNWQIKTNPNADSTKATTVSVGTSGTRKEATKATVAETNAATRTGLL
jgi:hypothetical protein